MTLPDFKPFLESVQPAYPRLFVTVSGSHLYGFPSEDSDYDLRGAFVRPTRDLLGLTRHNDTVELIGSGANPNDVVLHEAGKYARLLLKNNGYVLEQILSPLVIETSTWHDELVVLAPKCVNARSQILLYIFRVLMTGLHLARTGIVEANIVKLNETFRLSFIDELVAQKIAREESPLAGGHALEFYVKEYERLLAELRQREGLDRAPAGGAGRRRARTRGLADPATFGPPVKGDR